MSQTAQLDATIAEFQAGVTATLRSWSALRTSAESEWGGPQSKTKAEELRQSLYDCFDFNIPPGKEPKPKMSIDEVEDNLFLYLEEEFSIVLEDNSEKQVAEVLFKMYESCIRGDFSFTRSIVQNAEEASIKSKSEQKKVAVVSTEDDESDDDDIEMEIESMAMDDGNNQPQALPTNIFMSQTAREYADQYLFGPPPGVRHVDNNLPVRQLGEAIPEKQQPEVDDDGFEMVTSKRK